MTRKEFESLKVGDHILKGKRKAKVVATFMVSTYACISFRYLDTQRVSDRSYRGLKLAKKDNKK